MTADHAICKGRGLLARALVLASVYRRSLVLKPYFLFIWYLVIYFIVHFAKDKTLSSMIWEILLVPTDKSDGN